MDDHDTLTSGGAARRRFLCGTGALTTGLAASACLVPASSPAATAATTPAMPHEIGAAIPVRLNVNGHDYDLVLEPRVTLLDALREYIGLSGTKKGCDRGQCGACTVLVNERRINACLALAVAHAGDRLRTVEGLADGAALIRCRLHSSSMTVFNAAIARRGKSARRSRCSAKRGPVPSAPRRWMCGAIRPSN